MGLDSLIAEGLKAAAIIPVLGFAAAAIGSAACFALWWVLGRSDG